MWDEAAKGFAYEVGQLVEHRARPGAPAVIIERLLTQCHGGIQRFYLCSHFAGAERHTSLMNEVELSPCVPNVDGGTPADWLERLSSAVRQRAERAGG